MLLQFAFSNHRSFAGRPPEDQHLICFRAGKGSDASQHLRRLPGLNERVLPVLGVYGANGAGKSSLIDALITMQWHVLDSFQRLALDAPLKLQPHRLRAADRSGPSTFDIEFVCAGVRYRYGFVARGACVEEEWLHAWPHGVRQIWLDRRGTDRQQWYRGPGWRGEWQAIVRATRDNALLLSVAASLNHAESGVLVRWFGTWGKASRGVFATGSPHRRFGSPLFEPAHQQRLLALLRAADLGVEDLAVVNGRRRLLARLPAAEAAALGVQLDREGDPPMLLLAHRGPEGELSYLEPEEESDGTLAFLELAHHILLALDSGGLLVIDELDASLHPLMTPELLRLFTDPGVNPRGAQLLFTTHDTSLMGHLRRDEILLVEKAYDGASSLTVASAFQIDKRAQVESLYRSRALGAVPATLAFDHALSPGARA